MTGTEAGIFCGRELNGKGSCVQMNYKAVTNNWINWIVFKGKFLSGSQTKYVVRMNSGQLWVM